MIRSVLVANRGEIACRIFRTLKRMGIRSIAVYSEADSHSMHVAEADEAIPIGPAATAESYLRQDRILAAAAMAEADAIHPGYGFLSEDPEFADACEAAGMLFIGPTGEQMRRFGFKHAARAIASELGAPLLSGTDLLDSLERAEAQAEKIGFPVMLKSTAGGGGIGIMVCRTPAELAANYEATLRVNRAAFKASGVFVEKYVENARHIEVQIFGDGKGTVAALGERDCSTQRRNQKVIEETPAPNLTETVRQEMYRWAVRLASAVQYRSAGTVEFLYDCDTSKFYFLEVNPRLQVEHSVTEAVTGLDLVEWMVRCAAGEDLRLSEYRHQPLGHAIQARIYAEDPKRNFQPSCGLLTEVKFPAEARVDTWIESGTEISPYYDPLLAKLIVHADTREQAVTKLEEALGRTSIHGIEPNVAYLRDIARSPTFRDGLMTTRFLGAFAYHAETIEVLEPGAQTLIQDYPARLGYWAVGVPPSGPMDARSFNLANRIAGNPVNAAGLEITMSGPALRFNTARVFALCGAPMKALLDGVPISFNVPIEAKAGSVLKVRNLIGGGARAYLAVRGGFDVPEYLGSRSTFALGGFGGHGGRALRAGDVLRLGREFLVEDDAPIEIPTFGQTWEIGVYYGPHGAPDFFTSEYIETFFSAEWRVHYHSDRTGVRLIGPKPIWARTDGGEAGLHPSNIHDNAYGVGSVDFTGDMPILLGPDGPSLGGFVCPAAIAEDELWKMGQLKAGDIVRFKRLTETGVPDSPILAVYPGQGDRPKVVYRRSGDAYLLIEFGPLELDLNLRFRVHALMTALEKLTLEGIVDLTPGIRSLQIHFDPAKITRSDLLARVTELEASLPSVEEMTVPARIVYLPLSWEDPQAMLAIAKYAETVRADAPWCPSNIEFIRRINGLESVDEVQRIIFDASYLVMGLGDVYLGAPVAIPLDPRHRLVTTKYNPARTWTPENAVGIGGAYMCVYGMEGPGGYQLFGRTVPVWNRFHTTEDFEPGKPWLLRFFDQIRFYPVSAEELLKLREDLIHGKFKLRIQESTFSLKEYHAFLAGIEKEAAEFKARQQKAFQEERDRWALAPDADIADANEQDAQGEEQSLAANELWVDAPVPGSLWKLCVSMGDKVKEGDKVAVLSAMKMEMAVEAPENGTVANVLVSEGKAVTAGQHLMVLEVKE